MTLDEFVAEAKRLARPARILRHSKCQDNAIGYWHGVEAGSLCASVRHKEGWLGVYLDEKHQGEIRLSLEPIKSESPLSGEEIESLPPVDAVFLLGGTRIEEYLKRNKWERGWGFNNNFRDPIAHEYERIWQKNCPMYSQNVVGVQGGWHFPWPDDDWEEYVSSELVLWTLEEAEPWVEVFMSEGRYVVRQRVT